MSSALIKQGIAFQQAGRLGDAKQIYEQVLQENPNHADGLHLLGLVAFLSGNHEIAEQLIRRAIANNNVFFYHSSLGNVQNALGRPDHAIESFQRALALKPDFPDALNNLGLIYFNMEDADKALDFYQRALAINPDHVDTMINMGLLLQDEKKYDEALDIYRRVVSINPNMADAYYNIGTVFQNLKKRDDALQAYQKANSLRPSASAYTNIGVILNARNILHEAMMHLQKALELDPKSANAYHNLALTYRSYGQLDKSIECMRKAIAFKPNDSMLYSTLLLSMVYAHGVSPEELAETAREYGTQIADKLLRKRPFENDKNAERKLRIGYVSAEFHEHPVSYFFEPLLLNHDRKNFEIFGYSNVGITDHVTERLKPEFDHWRDIRDLDDDEAADLIESDRIDIIIDLMGHTGENRMPVLARKPAPVQATWLGFPATTGMKAIDYRITDIHAEPAGMTEHLGTEKLVRLPEIFCCYKPHENSPAVIDHPPFEDNGYITFGCFNYFGKVSDDALKAWAAILKAIPDARLLLEIGGIDGPQFRAEVENRMQRAGLPLERVILEIRKKANQFVLYNRLDIALDPFPCVGGTTSMDTLWMGVPFVTLAGKSLVSRMGVTILTNAGLPELIAADVDDYVQIATDLAWDRDRLKKVRHNLRENAAKSPLMDQKAFARNMEAAYRQMWHNYCSS